MSDRCLDCGIAASFHVTSAGKFIGCPVRASHGLARGDLLPRIVVRVGKAGARKGKVLVVWPDQQDGGSIMVWDMATGEHYLDDSYQLQRSSRRAGQDQEREVQAEVEYQLGGKVRVVRNAGA